MNKVLYIATIACLIVRAFSACKICFAENNLQNSDDRACFDITLFEREIGTPQFFEAQAPFDGDIGPKINHFRHALFYDCPCIFTAFSSVDYKGKTNVYDNYDLKERLPVVPTLDIGFCAKSWKMECNTIPGHFE